MYLQRHVCVCSQLEDALQISTQAAAELSLQQKLRDDGQQRVEELEETLLEKEQELQRLQLLVNRLQGEVCSSLKLVTDCVLGSWLLGVTWV